MVFSMKYAFTRYHRGDCRWRSVLSVVCLIILGAAAFGLSGATTHLAPARILPGTVAAYSCNSGPWGQVAGHVVLIEPPDGLVPPTILVSPEKDWFFKGYTRQKLAAFLSASGVSNGDAQALVATATPDAGGGLRVTPPLELRARLTPDQRSAIYAELGHWPENFLQYQAFRFRDAYLSERLDNTCLSPTNLDMLRGLFYPRGPFSMFADSDLAFDRIASQEEKACLFKLLYRQSTILLTLHVPAKANLQELAAYWGAHGRETEVRPLLEPLAKAGGDIDVSRLLPSLARTLFDCYRQDDDHVTFEDCHWTSFNFFRDTPENRAGDASFFGQRLQSDYVPVNGHPVFGDVILLRNAQGLIIHSCNYICDDVVFTKNGGALMKPWVFADLKNLVEYYSLREHVTLCAVRLKP